VGGALIGASASLFLLSHGKVAGISGLFGGLLRRGTSDRALRLSFVLGLFIAGLAMRIIRPSSFSMSGSPASLIVVAMAGLLVGFGTQLGNGCTSGHGICGVSRLSIRSIVATWTFMATGIATVYIVRSFF